MYLSVFVKMKKLLLWISLCTGLLSASEINNNTNIHKNISTPRTEEIVKMVKNDVLFTIDDGPTKFTLPIAEQLDSSWYEWIFFVIGSSITEKTRKNLIEVVKMWHKLWNHSFSHHNFAWLNITNAKKEILKTDVLIKSILDEAGIVQKQKYIRYPFGSDISKKYRNEFNTFLDSLWYTKPMFWRMDVDFRDRKQAPNDYKISTTKPNDTILMHERSWTVESIQKICKNLDDKEWL